MARVNKSTFCMFCGEAPCICNAPAKKERAPRVAKLTAQEVADAINEVPVETGAHRKVEDFMPPPRRPSPFPGFVHPTQALAAREGKPIEHTEELRAEAIVRAADTAKKRDDFERALVVIRDAHILSRADQHRIEQMAPRVIDPALSDKIKAWKEARNVQQQG